jgi:3-isopropylmalate/(R)-2-methylmalate dehydratase small subunit
LLNGCSRRSVFARRSENPDFVLNQAPYRNAKILIGVIISAAGRAASTPLGAPRFRHPLRHRAELCRHLLQYRFKNASAIELPKEIVDELMEDAGKGANAVMTIDLRPKRSRPDGEKVHFELDAFRKHCL